MFNLGRQSSSIRFVNIVNTFIGEVCAYSAKKKCKCFIPTLTIIMGIFAFLNNLNFHPREVYSRYCDPKLQVGESLNYLLLR